MRQQRSGLKSGLESPAPYAAHSGPPLASDHIDRLLEQLPSEPAVSEPGNPAPMHGIWLGVALGVVLWCVIVGAVLFARWG